MHKVKLISKQKVLWRRQLPGWGNQWENCTFLFDENEREYDYLVVFDDLPNESEILACPKQNTILIVTEPISVKAYSKRYTQQFGTVISPQEPFAIEHPNIIHTAIGFPWSYGIEHGSQRNLHEWVDNGIGFDDFVAMEPPTKTKGLATVCSGKGSDASPKIIKRLFHKHRLEFTQRLKQDLPLLDFYGRDSDPIKDKAEAIKDYKYHLAIENYSCDNWWTEKIADAYLGYALPIWHGCPNLAQFFPEDSYIHINIYDYKNALETIKKTIENNEYEKRLPAIMEARKRLLYEHNIFALIHQTINTKLSSNNMKIGGQINSEYLRRKNRWNRFRHRIGTTIQRRKVKKYLRQKIDSIG